MIPDTKKYVSEFRLNNSSFSRRRKLYATLSDARSDFITIDQVIIKYIFNFRKVIQRLL